MVSESAANHTDDGSSPIWGIGSNMLKYLLKTTQTGRWEEYVLRCALQTLPFRKVVFWDVYYF